VKKSFSILLAAISLVLLTFTGVISTASATSCDPGPGRDLSGCDFSNLNLQYADFSDANLTGAVFNNNVLSGTWWARANLSGASIRNSNLEGAWFGGATCDGLVTENLSGRLGTNLYENDYGHYLIGGKLVAKDAVATNLAITGWDFTGFDFGHADLSGGMWDKVRLSSANLSNAKLSRIRTGGVIGIPSLPPGWVLRNSRLLGPEVTLTFENLSGLDLSGLDLSDSLMQNVNLVGANISGSNFSRAYIARSDLSNATVTDANFSNADLTNATLTNINFSTATLANANLRGSNVTSALFAGANLTGANLTELIGAPASVPDGWQFTGGSILRPNTNPPTPSISGADLCGVALQAATGSWPAGTTIQYFWKVAGRLDGESSSYVPKGGDIGKQLVLEVTGRSPGFLPVTVSTAPRVIKAQKFNSIAPAIVGPVRVGKTVSAKYLSWAIGAKTSLQWLLDGKLVKGATKRTLKLLPLQRGHKLSLKVTQTASGCLTATRTTSQIKVG